MQRVAAVKHTFSVEDVYARASRTLEKCISHGATRMRTHLELDGRVEMRSFEAIDALRRDYVWAIDIEVCVFPQEGLTGNPRSDALLVEGLRRGAKVLGGRVAVGHMCKLSTMPIADLRALARRIADAAVVHV